MKHTNIKQRARRSAVFAVMGLLGMSFAPQMVHSQTAYEGVATHFEALGTPYGGCGVPPSLVETDNYVALNVYASPEVGTMWTRPLTGADVQHMGMFANGTNCGRWVKVTIGADCIDGTNDGKLGEPFCRGANGKWLDDTYSGATLYMIVTDACGDNNGWCRDSKYHLDLHTPSLNRFIKDGQPVGDMLPTHFNNRKISWEFVESPNYSGDIEIYFMEHAKYYWPAILIGHLQNGISRVEQKINGAWVSINMNSDMGQAFILKDFNQPYIIRVYDVDGNLINNGREYSFSLPTACAQAADGCTTPVTKQTFTTKDVPITQTIQLAQGWNLIAINLTPADNSIATLFKSLDVTEIKTMDSFWRKDQADVFNLLKSLTAGEGYLVNMNSAATLSLTGTPLTRSVQIPSGSDWQLIGNPYQKSVPFVNLFTASDISMIKNFEGFWIPDAGAINSISSFEVGKGYFVKK